MTVAELKKLLENIPDNMIVCAVDMVNLKEDDYAIWEVETAARTQAPVPYFNNLAKLEEREVFRITF